VIPFFTILLLFRIVGGVESKLGSLGTSATEWPIVPAQGDCGDGEFWLNDVWQGKPKYSEETCPSATLSTTNPTRQIRARTRALEVGSRRLTALAMARPPIAVTIPLSPFYHCHNPVFSWFLCCHDTFARS
jgi:hypothetical protein